MKIDKFISSTVGLSVRVNDKLYFVTLGLTPLCWIGPFFYPSKDTWCNEWNAGVGPLRAGIGWRK